MHCIFRKHKQREFNRDMRFKLWNVSQVSTKYKGFPWGPLSVTAQHRNLLPNLRGFSLFCLPHWIHKTKQSILHIVAECCLRCWCLTDCGPPGNTSLVVCSCLQHGSQKLRHLSRCLQVFSGAAVHWALFVTVNVMSPKIQIKSLYGN